MAFLDLFSNITRKNRQNDNNTTRISPSSYYEVLPEEPVYQRHSRNELALALSEVSRNNNYNRYLDVCEEAFVDSHVDCIFKTIKFTIGGRKLIVVDNSGEINEEKTKIINYSWKKNIIDFYVKSRLLGYGCIEIGNWSGKGFDFLNDVNRKLVVLTAEGNYLVKNQYSSEAIVDLNQENNFCFLYYAKLGEISSCLKSVISKSTADLAIDSFNEKRSGAYLLYKHDADLSDPKRKEGIFKNLQNLVSKGYAFLSSRDNIEIVTTPSDSVTTNIAAKDDYRKEISNALLGNTMLFQDGASYSQAEVHEKQAFRFLADYIEGFVSFYNEKLIERLIFCGCPLSANDEIKIENSKPTLQETLATLALLLPNYEIDEEKIKELTGVDVEVKKFSSTPYEELNTIPDDF